jgi:aerotaxis receptor
VPMREDGQVIGYMSVRTRADRAEIEAAEKIYRAIKEGKANGVAIRRGGIIKTSLAARIKRAMHINIGTRLHLSMGTATVAMYVIGALSQWRLHDAVISTVCWVVGTVSAFYWIALWNALIGPLRQAIAATYAIAGGDLSLLIETNRHDESGQLLRALRQMNINLTAMIGDVRTTVESMGVATGEIATGNDNLAHRTAEQAAGIERTASSMTELRSAVKMNVDNAIEADKLAASASSVAVRGGEVVNQTRTTMDEISTSSRKIVEIISLIDSISFQTNILALNAAVEAARAGEQGRGFAVVASEVRSLAQRSAGAAKEIKKLIEDSVDKVAIGNRLVDSAGKTMIDIVQSVQSVTEIMRAITTANAHQTEGIDQIHDAVTHIDHSTQQNSVLVQQAAVAAFSLENDATRLLQAMSVFKFVHGNPTAPRYRP